MRFLIVFVASLAMAVPAMGEQVRQITVTGEGRVDAAPDMATISLGVVTEGKTAAEAMAANSERVSAMLKQLSAAGIEDRDMQTSNLNINPRMDHNSSSTRSGPLVVGFIASNTVAVRMRDLETMGATLDSVLESGANQFHGLSFGFQDPQPHQDDARRRAVEDARRKAELYAEAAGVTLGNVMTIAEHGRASPQPMMMMEASMARGADVPIASGEVTTQANVTIVYELAGGE